MGRWAALLLVLFLCAAPAQAPAQVAVGLSPALIDRRFEPGQAWAEGVFVRNNSDRPLRFRASVQDVWYNEKNEITFSDPSTAPRSAAAWIVIIPRELFVPPGESRSARLLVTPPPGIQGGYYAVVFFETEAGTQQAPLTEILHTVRLGSVLLLRCVGTESYQVEIVELQATPASAGGGIDFHLVVRNRGNTHVYTDGVVALLNQDMQLVGRTRLQRKPVLPGQARPTQASWVSRLEPGQYLAVVTLSIGDQEAVTSQVTFEIPRSGAN